MAGTPTNPIPSEVYKLDWETANGSPPTFPPDLYWSVQRDERFKVEDRMRVTDSTKGEPVRGGGYGVRFELHKGDLYNKNSRSELSALGPVEPVGAERWYGFSIYLPDASRGSEEWKDAVNGEIVTQWHQQSDNDSPPLAIVTHNGKWKISQRAWGDPDVTKYVWEGPYETGRWTDWVVHAKWSTVGSDTPDLSDPEALNDPNAFLHIWKDGKQVWASEKKKNAYLNQGNYIKIGIYKFCWNQNPAGSCKPEPTTDPQVRVMYHDELRIADGSGSRAAVEPPAIIRRNSMAYTFEELLANSLPYDPNTEYLTVLTTVVITQEDGRTGFIQDALVFDPTAKRLEKGTYNADSADDCFIYFSDRGRFGENPDRRALRSLKGKMGPAASLSPSSLGAAHKIG